MKWTLESLTGAIHQWGREREIHRHGDLAAQAEKLVEEAQETLAAAPAVTAAHRNLEASHSYVASLDAYNTAYKPFIDGIGDTFVVLVQLCAIAGVTLEDCVEAAYEEIRDRKGHLNEDGVFVKESE